MSIHIRPSTPDEFVAFAQADASGFGFELNLERLEQTRPIWEFDRSLASFDGEEIVGTTGIFPFDLTVPGAALPTAGVTWVAVKPTHRRQGVLTGLMRQQLADVRERGEPLAALWASESIIYGRFGYGLAAQRADLTIDRLRTGLAHETPACGRLRLISREEALQSWPAIYDEVCRKQPGMYTRSKTWWEHKTLRQAAPSGGPGRFFVQYEEDGQALGYARYQVRGGDEDGLPGGTLSVRELMATTQAAYTALWRYLFGIDLVTTIEAWGRAADEPLYWMLADSRRLARRPGDSLWVRIVDIPSALEGRRYSTEGRLVMEVRDSFCPWNEGRYELEAGPDGARCRRSDAEPEMVLDAADLGAAYLGGARLRTLERAGRVRADEETLARADSLFSWDPLPWCPEVF